MGWALKKTETELPDLHLSGEKTYLRPPRQSDWQNWRNVRAKNKARLQIYEPAWPPNCLSEDFFKRRISRQTRDWKNDRAYSFLILDSSQSALIGGININNVIRGVAQHASLGYWIDEKYQGKGYMRDAVNIALSYGFKNLKLHRINASCVPDNARSKHLLLKCGFEEEGYARKYLKINSLWQDHILFGLCADHFYENTE